jgi:hypothetical protein
MRRIEKGENKRPPSFLEDGPILISIYDGK